MKKQWATEEGVTSQEGKSVGFQQPIPLSRMIGVGMLCMLGVLLPRAIIYGGCAPFGVAFASVLSGMGGVGASVFSLVGYLLPSEIVFPLRYIASVSIVFGLRWALGAIRSIGEKSWFPPCLTAVSLLITGTAVNRAQGFQWDVFFAHVCESLLAAGFAFFYHRAVLWWENADKRGTIPFTQQMSLVVVTASVLMSLYAVGFADVSVGRIVTMLLILFAAKSAQEYAGMLSGVVLGAAAALCMPSHIHMAMAYSVGGLLGGVFSRFGKVVIALVFGVVQLCMVLATGDVETVAVGIYEWIAAVLLFMLFPPSAEKAARTLFCRTRSDAAVEGMKRSLEMRLRYAADTIRGISKTVDAVSVKMAAMEEPKMKSVYADVCEHICNGCSSREQCWKVSFTDTMAHFRTIGRMLRQNGAVTLPEAGAEFSKHCRHAEHVLGSMNKSYAGMLSKKEVIARLNDMRVVVFDQFDGVAALINGLSDELREGQEADEQLAAQIERICGKYHLPVIQVVCLIGRRHRLTVDILLESGQAPPTDGAWAQEIREVCGRDLGDPILHQSGYLTEVQWREQPRLRVRTACAQRHCPTEKYCGDHYETVMDRDGRFCAVLSDGMGSGGRAAVDGAMTAALAAQMMEAGFREDRWIRMINSALILKSGEESSSTVDALQIDLFTGRISGVKAGAAPSFIYSGGHVCRLQSSSLPIGILPEVDATFYEEYITAGDWIVVVSDGVASDDCEWLERLIEQDIRSGRNEQNLAEDIVCEAIERQGDHGDDTTALILRIL